MNFNLLAPYYDLFHRGAVRTARRLASLADMKKSDLVLDIGGGTGRIAHLLADAVREITVLDPATAMIEQCKKKNKKGVQCVLGQAQALPFVDALFDLVIMVDAFHHFEQRERVIAEVWRVLKPGGMVVVEEFHPRRLKGRFVVLLEKMLRMSSVFFRPEEMIPLWGKAGFQGRIENCARGIYFFLGRKNQL